MIFSLLASAILIVAFSATLLRRFDLPILKLALLGASLAGLYFVWNPEHLTWRAHMVGVGRGADLVAYGSSLLFFLTVVAIAARRRDADQQLTRLVREIAVLHARPPADRRWSGRDTDEKH